MGSIKTDSSLITAVIDWRGIKICVGITAPFPGFDTPELPNTFFATIVA